MNKRKAKAIAYHCFASITEEIVANMDWSEYDERDKEFNGRTDKSVKREVKYSPSGQVTIDGINVMLIRGWGHLTGEGALNLPYREASKIQDDFGEWIVKKLKQEV